MDGDGQLPTLEPALKHDQCPFGTLGTLPPRATEVEEWLARHNLHECMQPLKAQGYDDLEDLCVLVATEPAAFASVIPKPGHRRKIMRLLGVGPELATPSPKQFAAKDPHAEMPTTYSPMALFTNDKGNTPGTTPPSRRSSIEPERLLKGPTSSYFSASDSSEPSHRTSAQSSFSPPTPNCNASSSIEDLSRGPMSKSFDTPVLVDPPRACALNTCQLVDRRSCSEEMVMLKVLPSSKFLTSTCRILPGAVNSIFRVFVGC